MLTRLLTILVGSDHPAQDDDDGACPACDNPFGKVSHMCFGPQLTDSLRS